MNRKHIASAALAAVLMISVGCGSKEEETPTTPPPAATTDAASMSAPADTNAAGVSAPAGQVSPDQAGTPIQANEAGPS